MTPREIIAASWAITTKELRLRQWAFAASLLETIFSVNLMSFQLYFLYQHFFGGSSASVFGLYGQLFEWLPFWLFVTYAVIVGIASVLNFFFPHVCLGAMIGLAAKSYRGEEARGGLVIGIYNFFPIFIINGILVLSSFSTVISISSLTLRYIDGSIVELILGMVGILFLFSVAMNFFFSFAEEAVVTQKLGIFEAIGRSFKLILSHLGQIVFLLLLLFVISLRILVNAVVVVLIPAIIIGLGLILTTILPEVVSYSIAGIVGLALMIGASYFFAYIHAFKTTVWTITYLELIKHKDLDVIVDGETI